MEQEIVKKNMFSLPLKRAPHLLLSCNLSLLPLKGSVHRDGPGQICSLISIPLFATGVNDTSETGGKICRRCR
jgi:hypothetical protein